MKKILLLLLILAALGAGWFLGHRQHSPVSATTSERKPLFYQCPMHPWIKSDHPGKCTICGMDLVAAYEQDNTASDGKNLTALGQTSLSVAAIATTPVTRKPLRRTLRVAGTIDDDDTKHRFISAYIAGRIDSLNVDFVGAEVGAGEVLGTFYSPELLAAQSDYLALKESGLDSLIAASTERLLRLGLTKEQIGKLGTGKPVDSTPIVAPMSGTVIERNAYTGQYVQAGEKLLTIADFAVMWFQFDAYEQDLPWLKIGQPIRVTPDGTSQSYDAAISFINPNLDPTTRTAKVRVEIPNPLIEENGKKHRALLHRLYATGQVEIDSGEVLLIPREAVLRPGEKPVVYVEKKPGDYQLREVKLGRRGDAGWEVLDGLTEGEKVVTSGNLLIDAQAQLSREGTSPAAPTAPLPIVEPLAEAAAALSAGHLDHYRMTVAEIRKQKPGVAEFSGDDLVAARKHFASFSTALANEVLAVPDQARKVKIYECPMTPAGTARWLQKEGPLHNPFLPKMTDCGEEVKP